MKEQIRDKLKMLENNLDNFNDYSLQFIDKKYLRKMISIWRWYISHDYFNEKHPQPQGLSSNPPIGWLHSELQGKSVPLARDIGMCISPEVKSSIDTKHAALRIMNRMNMIYGYVTLEDARKDQQAHHDNEMKKMKDYARARKAREDRKPDKKALAKELAEKESDRLSKKYLKEKDKQREELRTTRETERQSVKKKAQEAVKKMKEEMKERRK